MGRKIRRKKSDDKKKGQHFFWPGVEKKVVDFFNKNNFLAQKVFFKKYFSEKVFEKNSKIEKYVPFFF